MFVYMYPLPSHAYFKSTSGTAENGFHHAYEPSRRQLTNSYGIVIASCLVAR